MLIAVAGMILTSCGGNKDEKKQEASDAQAPSIEEQAQQSSEVIDAATLSDDLQKGLEAEDSEGFKGKIESAKAYAQKLLSEGKGEEAKGILEKIQTFLSENADKVTSVVGDNKYVQSAIDWVKNVDAGESGVFHVFPQTILNHAYAFGK